MGGSAWSRDEYLITLDLYLNEPNVVEDENDPAVREVAQLIDRSPGAVALRLANYRHLDPRSTKGMSHVSEGCREIWEEYYRNEEELSHAAELARERLSSSEGQTEGLRDEIVDTGEVSDEGTRRTGQSDFRLAIRSRYQDTCLLCDVSEPGLLQAGHILEWSEFENRRGDPDNGLLLCYTHHRAFDLGMFTISSDYELIVRPGFSGEGEFLQKTLIQRESLDFPGTPPSEEYLERHNERLSWWPIEENSEAE